MTGQELITEVEETLNDSSFTRERIKVYLNRAMRFLASKVYLERLSNGYAVVDTAVGEFSIPMPSDYFRELYSCKAEAGHEVKIYANLSDLRQNMGEIDLQAGNIVGVCESGGKLYYQCVPSVSKKLCLMYYSTPPEIEDTEDSHPVEEIETDLVESATRFLIAYASWLGFHLLEQGEAQQPDIAFQQSLWLATLEDFTKGTGRGTPTRQAPVCRSNF